MKSYLYLSLICMVSLPSLMAAQNRLIAEHCQVKAPQAIKSQGIYTEPTEPDFVLHRNFPNPVTGYLSLKYDINRPGRYILRVVDGKGNVLENLIDRVHQKGSFQYKWLSQPQAHGVQMFRVLANNRLSPPRMLMLKY
ncbi:MAG: hypothetical protein AAFR61_03790 [Bacteroidota bacterium]